MLHALERNIVLTPQRNCDTKSVLSTLSRSLGQSNNRIFQSGNEGS